MRALIPFLTVVGILSGIATGWWNIIVRKKYYEARLMQIGTDTIESDFARWARRILTGIVLFFVGSALLAGGFIFLKTLIELFV